MFYCPTCDEHSMYYDFVRKLYRCTLCEVETEPIAPVKTRCFSCYREYNEYTWFDPSGCPHCRRSFVD